AEGNKPRWVGVRANLLVAFAGLTVYGHDSRPTPLVLRFLAAIHALELVALKHDGVNTVLAQMAEEAERAALFRLRLLTSDSPLIAATLDYAVHVQGAPVQPAVYFLVHATFRTGPAVSFPYRVMGAEPRVALSLVAKGAESLALANFVRPQADVADIPG